MSLSGLQSAIRNSLVHGRRNVVSTDNCIEIFSRTGFDTEYPSGLSSWNGLPVFRSMGVLAVGRHQSTDRSQ